MLDFLNILEKTIEISRRAGEATLAYYGQVGEIEDKGNDSPLTKADLLSDKIIKEDLAEFGWPILSEEGVDTDDRFGADYVWIVDPLDGTKDFIQETGEFTVMVGLVQKQIDGTYRPVLGVIYRPVAETTYCAVLGEGAWSRHDKHGAKELSVSREKDWHNITMLTSRNHTTDLEWIVAKDLGIQKIMTFGSSLKACLIAEQVGDFNFNPAPHTWEWDVCASDIIIHEAGGNFTDCQGDIITYNKKKPQNIHGYIASNGIIYKNILQKISSYL